jgi:FAD binding domain
MTAEYKCLFGISGPVPGLTPGSYDVTHAKDVSTLTITGKDGKVYWFLFGRMNRVYKSHEIPRFGPKDASLFASQHMGLPIMSHGQVQLSHLWESQKTSTLVALEEADFAHWTLGRLVCLGDSAHKMTPNSGTGGMTAIESAASLANAVYRFAAARPPSPPTTQQVETVLKEFESGMKMRASGAIKAAADVTRVQALRTFKEQLIAHYVIPYAGDLVVDQSCETWVGAARIDYLPVPQRSLAGHMPFNPSQGIGKEESRWLRIVLALPLLVMAVAAFQIMFGLVPYEEGFKILDSGVYRWKDHELKILDSFYRISFFDSQARPGVLVTTPSQVGADTGSWFQMFSFLADFGVWYAIMLIESARRANQFSILRL